ncbi:NFACT family protein [Helicobacter turcicus]|uniref:NFACT family protein n=1 Tax=Helicobacter turcicus TaxID=2867412 RepID=A0ABS7JN47_9HELI|nr:NFACT family protein [Helicobacter turcicus]MBX7490825.1 NFACT family protein [Helicobacter turcicus]MBX7545566.1 NFACT family protein [Helicobacter turcicus]
MNLSTLQKFATYLTQTPPLKLRAIRRIGDNLFKLDVNGALFFIDLRRGKSTIFTTDKPLIASKTYQAPFDQSLQKYCFNAQILKTELDGNNRILQLLLQTQNSYKTSQITLQIEFTGRNTNLIILDSNNIVLDALHHITKEQSFREVKIQKPLLPLPQPTTAPTIRDEGELFSVLAQNFKTLKAKELEQKIQKSTTILLQKIAQIKHFISTLEDKNILESNAKQEAHFGQLILQNLYLYPNFKGASITLDSILITLPNKAHSLSHAAQIFFENSKKLTKKAKNIHLQAQNLNEKLAFYENLLKMIQNVTNYNDLQILNSNFQKDSIPKDSKHKHKNKQFESFFIESIKVSIGKSERENIALLKEARAEDIWMHIRDIPSSHCIIHCGKSKISDIILYKAAKILIGFTKSFSGNYNVDYTRRKFVKITQGANVLYAKEQTLQLKKD